MIPSELKVAILGIITKDEVEIKTEIKKLYDSTDDYGSSKTLYVLKDLTGELYNIEYTEIPFIYSNNFIDDEIIQDLLWTENQDINLGFKAKICDCIWVNKRNYDYAIKAYNLYKEVLLCNNDFEKNYYILNRVISIALSMGEKSIPKEDFYNSIILVIEQSVNDETAMTLKLMEACCENDLIEVDRIIDICEKKTEKLKNSYSISIQEGYFELSEKLYAAKFGINLKSKNVRNTDIIRVRRLKADMYIDCAKKFSSNRMLYINNITKAVNILKLIDNTEDERQALLKDLAEVQKEAINEMHLFKHSADITDFVNKIKGEIGKLELDEAIFYLFTSPIVQKEQAIEDAIKSSQKYPLSKLFPVKILDKHGRTIGNVPSITTKDPYKDEETLISNVEYELQTTYRLYADAFIKNALAFIRNKFIIDISNIEKVVADSIFVPKEREKAFTKGLMAGFNYDFITSLSILVPQLEYSVRCLAKKCGDVVFNINESGIQEYKTLNALLELPNLNDIIDEDIIFNLKAIFTSKYGMNIRNNVSHGNYDDTDFSSLNLLYAWWFILRLCYTFAYECYNENYINVYNKIKE